MIAIINGSMINYEGFQIMSSHLGKQYKIILIGDGAVGKTSLLTRYLQNYFEINTKLTVGASVKFQQIINIIPFGSLDSHFQITRGHIKVMGAYVSRDSLESMG